MSIPPRLRALIVEALYPESAHKLPDVCVRFGLAGGEGEEAFRSKRAYIERRLSPLPLDRLLAVARAVEADISNYELGEALAKIEEKGGRTVSEPTRRDIIAVLEECSLSGRIELFDFIRDLWPVDRMPSPYASDDGTFLGAMHQHMRRNEDWTGADLLQMLGVLDCSQRRLFVLLEAVVHPRTRRQDEGERLAGALNAPLRRDGFALLPTSRISGYPVYSVREVTPSHGRPADAEVSAVLAAFGEEGVHAAWMKALDRRDRDPEGAITMARTLLKTVCKQIIEDAGDTYGESDDLPRLYHAAAEKLNLAPSQHIEGAFKAILGNCQAVVQGIGTLRNRLGDPHGRGRNPVRPQSRHAALVVNLAGTMAAFLVATWTTREAAKAV